MEIFEIAILAINAILLMWVLYLGIRMAQAGSTYMWNPGDEKIKSAMRDRILRSIVKILFVGFAMIFLNLAVSYIV